MNLRKTLASCCRFSDRNARTPVRNITKFLACSGPRPCGFRILESTNQFEFVYPIFMFIFCIFFVILFYNFANPEIILVRQLLYFIIAFNLIHFKNLIGSNVDILLICSLK